MKISSAYVNVTSPGRNFVTLKVETDEGIYGLGDATLNGRELAVASYLSEHVIPCIIGRDPFSTEDIWQYLYRGAYWRRGPVTMAAIAAVDVALWDIKGKALNTPVYNLLGGKSREGVLVYCHAFGNEIETGARRCRPASGDGLQGHPRAKRSDGAEEHRMEWPRGRVAMSPRNAACLRSMSGRPSPTCAMCLSCLRACAKRSAKNCTCSTTAITA